MEDVFAVYVWSQDWWTFSNDSWSARDQVYEDSRIVSPDKVNWQKVSDGEAYHASLYFEIGKTDAHNFRPTSIRVDNVEQPTMVIVEGEEMGDEDVVLGMAYPFEFAVGQEGYYESPGMDLEDFVVTEIIAAKDEEEKEDAIVSFIEGVNEADMATVESMAAETFSAPRKKPSKRDLRRANRRRRNKNMMKMKEYSQGSKRTKDYTTTGYAETLAAETFHSETASDNISAETSKAVEGINPTPVSDGQWLAETISKQAEAKHSYPHRVIDGDDYVHYDGKGRQTGRTNRGRSISADRRRYTPNADLKPGQGHRGDFVREAHDQGYDARLDDSMGERNRGRHHGKMSMHDRRDMSEGEARHMGRRKYSNVGTMDMGNRMMAEHNQGYNARLDESMGERNRGRHHGKMSMHDRRDMSEGEARHMGRRKYSNVGTMDRNNRMMMAESAFDKLQDEVADEYEDEGMSEERAMKIGGAVAYDARC